MFFSRLILNQSSPIVRRHLNEAFELHRTVMSAFPQLTEHDRSDPDSGSILWRVDRDQRNGLAMLIVQSEIAPDWQSLLDRFPKYVASPLGDSLPPIDTKQRELEFHVGQRLSFRLRANPTRKIKVDGRKNGRRVGLVASEEQLAWLQRKFIPDLPSAGARILSASITSDYRSAGSPKCNDAQRDSAIATTATQTITHVAVRFEGVLEVAEPDAFQLTLRRGIGSAKGFGFGLLSLARI